MVRKMIRIDVAWDDEAKVWIALCDEIGLALESESYDELVKRVTIAAPEMAELNHMPCNTITILTEERQIACA